MVPHRHLRVFLASPNDVRKEADIVGKVIGRINREISGPLGVSLEVMRGTTHGVPGMARPQSLISPLVDQCDIFIGILWTRFGTPPGPTDKGVSHHSGTEEEFDRALVRWKDNGAHENALPRIMMYFSRRPTEPAAIDSKQIGRIAAFRGRFAPDGRHAGLVCEYESYSKFEEFIHQHLLQRVFTFSGGIPRSQLVADFVALSPDEWEDLFRSRHVRLLIMYSRTWRNTYLQQLRDVIRHGGQLEVLLPLPRIENRALELMAIRIGETAAELCTRISEAANAFEHLRDDGPGVVDVRYTNVYLNHALYLFDRGGILALYAFRSTRVPSPAIRMFPGPLLDHSVADFDALFSTGIQKLTGV